MLLSIITPESQVFAGEVQSVILPGVEGKFQILNNHAPFISALEEGVVKVKMGSENLSFNIKSGIADVLKNKISILTEGVAK
jgi:F-type H+-transporting ATPase subunit epsilon